MQATPTTRSRSNHKKLGLALVLGLTLTLAPVRPAYAEAWNPFTPFIQLFESYLTTFVDWITQFSIPSLFTTLQTEMSTAFSEAVGALGLPDPNTVRQKLDSLITANSMPDFFNSNVTSRKTFAANEADRQSARAAVSSILGAQGQQNTKDNLDYTNSIMAGNAAALVLGTSFGPGVCTISGGWGGCWNLPSFTQTEAILYQNSNLAALVGGLRADNLIAQQASHWGTLVNAEVAEAIDEQNRADQSRATAEAVRTGLVSESTTLF